MGLHILGAWVHLMRFSSIFQFPLTPLAAQPVAPARVEEPPAPAATQPDPAELPDDLDQRVRLVGEWQLGEG